MLNPVLDRVKFWRVLEVLISRLTGVQPRLAMK
ncbi:MAG: fatty acid desaturase CarF family protein [Burkholderiales bacterium]